MLKSLVVALAFLSSANAFAQTSSVEEEVMGLLVANASSIELMSGGQKSETTLVDVLAGQLSIRGYLGKRGEAVVLAYSSVQCKDVTKSGLVGASQYECSVVLGNGDFVVGTGRLKGPELESTVMLTGIKINKVVAPKAKAQLTSKTIQIEIAG